MAYLAEVSLFSVSCLVVQDDLFSNFIVHPCCNIYGTFDMKAAQVTLPISWATVHIDVQEDNWRLNFTIIIVTTHLLYCKCITKDCIKARY